MQRIYKIFLPSFLLLLTSFSQTTLHADEGTPEGLWRSVGYGLLLEAKPDSIKIFEVTALSCLPSTDKLKLEMVKADGSWQLEDDGVSASAWLRPVSATGMRMKWAGAASNILFKRVAKRPDVCNHVLEDTPINNFDVFWTSYKEHYPLFDMKGIDWDAVRATVRPQITANTTQAELYDHLASMITPLKDAHTGITMKSPKRRFGGLRDDPALAPGMTRDEIWAQLNKTFAQALDVISSKYIVGELQSFCRGHLRFGRLPGDLIYLRLDEEGDYTETPGFAAQLVVLEKALDDIFASATNAKGLVFDVRRNSGGDDPLSIAVASRLTDRAYYAYSKVARSDPNDPTKYTPGQVTEVPPSSRPSFHGPVIELTGLYSISAAETLTQALMGRMPKIVRVGENTQGVFSDTLGRGLPNGARFWFPNELFLTKEGKYFDGPGIPVDVQVPVFQASDIAAGRDPALEKAMMLLQAP